MVVFFVLVCIVAVYDSNNVGLKKKTKRKKYM